MPLRMLASCGGHRLVTVRLPDGFDADRHAAALARLIADRHGAGFEVVSIDPAGRTAYATRQVAINEVTSDRASRDGFEVCDWPAAPGPRHQARGRRAVGGQAGGEKPGVRDDSVRAVLGQATLSRLDSATSRCRAAVAVALGVKPSAVWVRPGARGGFDVQLPGSYSPSRHDRKPAEVATSVVGGAPATPVVADPPRVASAGTAHRAGSLHRLVGPVFRAAGVMPGSGKTNLLNAAVAGSLAAGVELVVVDLPSKSVDFLWCKTFVRPGGWGCDSPEAAVTVLDLVPAEGRLRARDLAAAGAISWTELPADERFPPILNVVDDASGLLPDRIPAGIPKDHQLAAEAARANLLKAALARSINYPFPDREKPGIQRTARRPPRSRSPGTHRFSDPGLGAGVICTRATDEQSSIATDMAEPHAGKWTPVMPHSVECKGPTDSRSRVIQFAVPTARRPTQSAADRSGIPAACISM